VRRVIGSANLPHADRPPMSARASASERKSRKQEYNHEVTDFRQCGNPDIDLDLREKMQHSNKLLSPEAEEIEKIPNIVI